MNITFKIPKYLPWYTITQKPHSKENDLYEEYDANKVKDQKENTIILHPAFSTMSILHTNALYLPQTRKQFN